MIGPLPGIWDKSFDQSCGSCAVWNLAPDDLPRAVEDKSANYWDAIRSHRAIEQVAISHGRPLAEVPFPAAVYAQNTGENTHDKVLRDREAAVAGEIAANQVPLTGELVDAFSLTDVIDYAAGRTVSAIDRPAGFLARIKGRLLLT